MCDALAAIVDDYAPDARFRQPERDEDDGERAPFHDNNLSAPPPHYCVRCNSGEHGTLDVRGVCSCCGSIVDDLLFKLWDAQQRRQAEGSL